MMFDEDPTDDVHNMSTEELLEEHDYFLQLTVHGDPDSVTQEDVRRFNRTEMELMNRIAHELFDNTD